MANGNELTVVHQERTEQEIIDALGEFAAASYSLVGPNHTYDTIKFFTQIITESPETYKKIFRPKTMEKLTNIVEQSKAGKMTPFEMIGIIGELKNLFK